MDSWKKSSLLGAAFCLYITLGAISFVQMEQPYTTEQRLKFRAQMADFVSNHSQCGLTAESLERLLGQVDTFQSHAVFLPDVNPESPMRDVWSIMNAFVFCYSIVSTIGFGWITPHATASQIFCVLYAVPGIAFHGYVLLVIGNTFKFIFTAIYRLFAFHLRSISSKHRAPVAATALTVTVLLWVVLLIIPAIIFIHTENWSFVTAKYFNFVCLSTVGFGDVAPTHAAVAPEDRKILPEVLYRVGILLYFMVSLTVMTTTLTAVWEYQSRKLLRLYGNTRRLNKNHSSSENGEEKDEEDAARHGNELTEDDVDDAGIDNPACLHVHVEAIENQ